MKVIVKKILQGILGFENYLFYFSLFIIFTLKRNKKEGDFLYFLEMIPDGGIILDIGANIGVMTYHFASRLKKSIIYAFEPIPYNFRTLRKIIKRFKLSNVKVYEHALGNENGEIEMVLPVVNSVKMHGLSHVIHDSITEFNDGSKYVTEVKKLDSLKDIAAIDIVVNAIKIDVENFEYFVLLGGKRLIEKHKPLIYAELWENDNREKCFKLLTEFGYQVKFLSNGKLFLFNKDQHKTQNFFFIHENSNVNSV